MEGKYVVIGIIALIVDIILNMVWPITIMTNVLLSAVFQIGAELAPQYGWLYGMASVFLAVVQYIIIYVAIATFLDDPAESINSILGAN